MTRKPPAAAKERCPVDKLSLSKLSETARMAIEKNAGTNPKYRMQERVTLSPEVVLALIAVAEAARELVIPDQGCFHISSPCACVTEAQNKLIAALQRIGD